MEPSACRPWPRRRPRHGRRAPSDGSATPTGSATRATWRRSSQRFGMELGTPGTERTPERFLKALYDATAGYEGDPKLLTAFPTECRRDADCLVSQVVEGPISFYALCEHHALPFHGFAYVGYVAHERIIGLSKLTRLVRLFSRRFTVQERLGEQIADALGRAGGAARRRGTPGGGAPLHADARRREEHSRTVTTRVARRLRGQPRAAARVPRPRYAAGTRGPERERARRLMRPPGT